MKCICISQRVTFLYFRTPMMSFLTCHCQYNMVVIVTHSLTLVPKIATRRCRTRLWKRQKPVYIRSPPTTIDEQVSKRHCDDAEDMVHSDVDELPHTGENTINTTPPPPPGLKRPAQTTLRSPCRQRQ